MPLVWLLWQGGFKFADHVTGRDLILALRCTAMRKELG
jgi:hypothetical protein